MISSKKIYKMAFDGQKKLEAIALKQLRARVNERARALEKRLEARLLQAASQGEMYVNFYIGNQWMEPSYVIAKKLKARGFSVTVTNPVKDFRGGLAGSHSIKISFVKAANKAA